MKAEAQSHYEAVLLLLAFIPPLPAVILAFAGGYSPDAGHSLRWALTGLAVSSWLLGAIWLRVRVLRALRAITNLLASLRHGDFSVRARRADPSDALGEVLLEINSLANTLVRERTGAVEATALLRKVMAAIDVAVFAFDTSSRLRLWNPAAERLVSHENESIDGKSAEELGLAALLLGEAPRTVSLVLAGADGEWELRRNSFRLQGLSHALIVLTDLRRALREQERITWQRLVRVLGHEINNSLTPIRAIAADLAAGLTSPTGSRPPDWEQDLSKGLAVIARRSEGLGRFMTSYAKLAKLPSPTLAPMEVTSWLRRIVQLENRLPVTLIEASPSTILGDADQLDQLLINLVGNAVEAALETGGGVTLTWSCSGRQVEILVFDEGPGISDTNNLFVPFFTTKRSGSGIGLVLSRQIAEAHQGTLALESRLDRPGALARIRLPSFRAAGGQLQADRS